MSKPKVVQIQTCVMGDNVNSAMTNVTTILYDDGSVYEGSMESTGGNYNDGYTYGMKWQKLELPHE